MRNAEHELRPTAGAQRTLLGVGSMLLIMIEASPLSTPQWYAGSGKFRVPMKEETSGASTRTNINVTVVSMYMPEACTSVS
jgi:hypothetical protein